MYFNRYNGSKREFSGEISKGDGLLKKEEKQKKRR